MKVWYNDNEPYVVQWLKNLMDAGQISPGIVDDRSIWDVPPTDLIGYDRCHFFAGIAGWELALQLAGWPDDWPVWTGSCPCQPFSAAGKRGGFADKRHLWPAWFHLIRVCHPPVIFGEQVASKDGLKWLDLVFSDLEAEGYSCGAADLPACSIGAPHIRQRLWFVALGENASRLGWRRWSDGNQAGEQRTLQIEGFGSSGFVAIANNARCQGDGLQPIHGRGIKEGEVLRPTGSSPTGKLADSGSKGLSPCQRQDGRGKGKAKQRTTVMQYREASNPWSDLVWLPCRDGKARPTQPGIFPLAHGVPGRVGQLRAYGNAIVPLLAAKFIESVMEMICPLLAKELG